MEEVVFSLAPGGPYARPTRGVDATVDLWCYDDRDLLVVQEDPGGGVAEALGSLVGLRNRVEDRDRAALLTETCLKAATDTVDPYLMRHECLLVPPLRYGDGRKYCRVWTFDEECLTPLYRDLSEKWSVEVEAKRPIAEFRIESPLLSLESLLPSLSTRQRMVLQTAYREGYYRIPRSTTTAAIADEIGVSRRTAEDHLRRAENKLVESTIEYL